MRLHRLEITCFGPFAGRETIDFDALAEHGLFLLNGPTGSGKTSILDAVCFALYGSLPGARQGTRALKSHHSPADAEPSVLLEVTAQGRRLEVRRTPEWSKPSTRAAAGSSVQKASTHVREFVDGDWRPLTSRNDEAGSLLASVLGMAREQFTRVVLLPQGEFASFLRAKASERVDLLEKLFGTQRFAEVEAQLGTLSQNARAAAESAERASAAPVGRLEAELAEHARPDPDGESPSGGKVQGEHETDTDPGIRGTAAMLDPQEPVDPLRVRELFDWADSSFSRRHAEALGECGSARGELVRVRTEAAAAERLLEDARELERARARRVTWEAQAGAQAERLSRLAAHRAAGSLRSPLGESGRTSREATIAQADAATAVEAASATGWEPPTLALAPGGPALPDAGQVRAAASSASSEAAVLAERVPLERELTALEGQRDADRSGLERAVGTARRLAAELESLNRELAALEDERARLEPIASTLPVAEMEAEAAEAVVKAVQDHAEALRAATTAEAEHVRCRGAALDAKKAWLELRERRLDETAAELAAQLTPHAPCPVCGSPDHPAPAAATEDPLALVDAERKAARESDAASELERRAHDAVASARERLAGVDARGGSTDPDKAVRVREDKLALVRNARDARVNLATVSEQALRGAQRRAAVIAELDEASAQRIRAEETLARRNEEIERRGAEVVRWRAGFPSVAQRQADVEARARTLGALEQSLVRYSAAAAARVRASDALRAALADTEFADEADARSALMDSPEAERLEAQTAAHEAEGQQLNGLFASAAVLRALEAEGGGSIASAESLAGLRTVEAACERRVRAAELAAREAESARARSAVLREQFEASVPTLEKARSRSHALGELAKTIRGQGENDRRMSLHSYVLAARLEQVAAAATQRLLAMSDGRFSLDHTDALAARGAASGLGIEVVDGWTGQRRDPSTLSGGESFMASLALALGLADVVQQESGGIDIETLFVDEGFGSLDEQALEQVMDAMEGLRVGGRVVGLVSHVSELKQRIPAQIRVSKGRTGSHVESVGLIPRSA
ncbi:SMC family ATPase [Sinomonas notoginsengisoli]|uniref:AAA family ATPase n=1 Tax=Sinomonas notoginsengisoli TaxID=1457311 RepID=UPI001F17FD86|nr:SMC family ATPase [Sinomonas notoginsengisoli]